MEGSFGGRDDNSRKITSSYTEKDLSESIPSDALMVLSC